MAKTTQIQIRTEPEIKSKLEQKAKELGFSSLSEYMLFVAQNAEIKVTLKKQDIRKFRIYAETEKGLT